MRTLALHCDEFRYSPEWRSGEATEGAPEGQRFGRCLLLLVSVEPGDVAKVGEAAKSIRRLVRKTEVDTVVINGFAHLSDNLAALEESGAVLAAIRDRVSDGVSVHVTPLGWHKRLEMTIRGDEYSQKFLHA